MVVVVTGGAGFLGARIVAAFLEGQDSGTAGLPAFDRIISLDLAPCPVEDPRVVSEIGSVTDKDLLDKIISKTTTAVIHLAAVVSSQAEAEFDLGMSVNVDGTRNLLDACRTKADCPFFFFSSSLAVFGADVPELVTDDQVLRPQSSYGTQKAVGELLVRDYSRRGFVHGVAGRLPTVVIRPGRPNAAASSFASSILREPINGEAAVCPVPMDLPLWISSPDAVVRNIVALATQQQARQSDPTAISLPGITVTPEEMTAALKMKFGESTAALVSYRRDPAIEAIVGTWPSCFDTATAHALGLAGDRDINEIIENYCALIAK